MLSDLSKSRLLWLSKGYLFELFTFFCIYNFPSSNEQNLISLELGVQKDQYKKATEKPYSVLYVDQPIKNIKRNLYGII